MHKYSYCVLHTARPQGVPDLTRLIWESVTQPHPANQSLHSSCLGLLRFCQIVFLSYFSKSSKVTLFCSVGVFDGVLLKPKGDRSWVFFGRTDAEAETPILWPPHTKSCLIGKDSDAGKDCGQEEKRTTEDELVGWHHRVDGHEFEDREALRVVIHGVAKRWTWLSDWNELNWTESWQKL